MDFRSPPKIKIMNEADADYCLATVYGLLIRNNVNVKICYGTLLGATRNGKFIKGDGDIDLIAYKEDEVKVVNLLRQLKEMKVVCQEDDIIKVKYKDISLDIYFLSSNLIDSILNRKTWRHSWKKRFISELYLIDGYKTKLNGKKYNCLSFTEEWLRKTYGKDWRTPQNKRGNTLTLTTNLWYLLTDYRKYRIKMARRGLRLIVRGYL